MSAPNTYSEWSTMLDNFGNGDDSSLVEMQNGSFVLDAGTASRFYSRVEEVYRKRKQSWLEKFQRSFQFQNLKTADDFEIVLRNGKQNLSPLIKFVSLKGFPEDLRNTLKKDLEDFVSEIKKSLKDNLSKTSEIREKMLITLNSFTINELPSNIPTDLKTNNPNNSDLLPPNGRKIIF